MEGDGDKGDGFANGIRTVLRRVSLASTGSFGLVPALKSHVKKLCLGLGSVLKASQSVAPIAICADGAVVFVGPKSTLHKSLFSL